MLNLKIAHPQSQRNDWLLRRLVARQTLAREYEDCEKKDYGGEYGYPVEEGEARLQIDLILIGRT
jgi:hypothetical protein